MKRYLILLTLLLPVIAWGQGTVIQQNPISPSGLNFNKQVFQWSNGSFINNLSAPIGANATLNNATPREGLFFFSTSDTTIQVYHNGSFIPFGGGGSSSAFYVSSKYFGGLGTLAQPLVFAPNVILQSGLYFQNNSFIAKYDSLQVLNLPVNGFNATNKDYVDGLINSKLDSVYAAGGYIQNSTISGGQQSGATINIDGGIITGTAASILGGGSHGTAIGLNGITFNFSGNGGAITNNSGNNSIDLSTSVSGHYYRFTSEATSTFAPVNANDLVRLTDLSTLAPTIYMSNGTLAGNRTVTLNGKNLVFSGYDPISNTGASFNIYQSGSIIDTVGGSGFIATSGLASSKEWGVNITNSSAQSIIVDYSATTGIIFRDGILSHGPGNAADYSAYEVLTDNALMSRKAVRVYGNTLWATTGSGVTSFATRTGAVTPQTGDYSSFYASLSASNNFTGGFTSQYNGGSIYPFTSINNAGITNTTASGVGVTIQSNTLSWLTGGFAGSLTMTPTANRTITLPDASGTVALTSGLPTGANPTASVTFTPVNGSATTFTRSDGAPKADSTVIRSFANSYSLSGMQTKLNNYLLKTDTTAMLGNVVHKALNETITGTKTFTPAPLFSAMTNHSVLFAGTSGLLSQDNNNFYYNSGLLSIGTGGDFTGTNTVNIYGQYDAYEPQSAIGTVTSATTFPGVTASTSRGTGTSPLVNNTGDLTGGFSGWGYTQASPAYTYMAGMSISMVGGTSSLGGQLDFYTKADGSTTTTSGLTIKNDQTLAFPHYTTAGILHNAVTTGVITSSLIGQSDVTNGFVDLTTNQTIATGHKTWTQDQNFNGRLFTGASIIPTVNQVDSIGTPSLMYSRIYTNSLLTSFFIGQGAGGKFSITTGGTTGDILWSLNNTVTNIATFFHTTGDAVFQTTTSPIVDSTAYKMNIYGRTRISQFTAASTNDSLMAFNPTTHALRMTKLVAGTGVSVTYGSGTITVAATGTFAQTSQSATYAILTTDFYVDCSGTFTATLPTAVGVSGKTYVITDTGVGVITVATTGGQTISGAATQTVAAGNSITVHAAGGNWFLN